MSTSLISLSASQDVPTLQLSRDLTRHLKRGHRWVYADSFNTDKNNEKKVRSGLSFLSYKKEILGVGFHHSNSALRFRMLCLADEPYFKPKNVTQTLTYWSEFQWNRAIQIRQSFDLLQTNCFRLINGEGDGLPGLIIDIYNNTAVIKFDNSVIELIWDKEEITKRLLQLPYKITCVYLKRRNNESSKGECLHGTLSLETQFKENKLLFSSNIQEGSKTGFFLDQRDSRQLIRSFSKNLSVLNLFSYTGGFSIYAAAGGASSVTSVDISQPAIDAIQENYNLNQLKGNFKNMALDAFEFVSQEIARKTKYDLVITDPPSFAPNEKSVPQATAAYIKIFSDSLKLVKPNGLFAASSCSSHISNSDYLNMVKESFSKARLRGTLIQLLGQPFDHPTPLAMDEMRYLKFALFRLD